MAETVSVRQRCRRRRVEAGAPRGTRSLALLAVLALSARDVDAGRSDVSWPHTDELGATAMAVDAAGAMVLTGCSAGGETFYVAKFSALGEPLWRESIRVGDIVAEEEQGDRGPSTTVCASALSTDAALNIYVAGSIESEAGDPSDAFVARLAPAGALEWARTLGTRFADVVTSLAVHDHAGSSSVFVGGYSAGNLSLGRESGRNCDAATLSKSGSDACDDGFLVRLVAADGTVVWTRSVASPPSTTSGPKRAGETRVFDVVAVNAKNADADSASLVIVGETRGRLTPGASTQQLERRHAGDVFVRQISLETGTSLWTTQLSVGDAATFCRQPAAAASSSQYTRVYARGRCSVALHNSREVSVAATTRGLLSTFPSQQQPYRDACRAACTQLFVARLELASGAVAWVRQAVNAAHTVAEGVLALPDTANGPGDVAVLGSADAGFFAGGAESMEQLAVLRVAGRDGLVRWTAELGLAGEDHAVALGISRDGALLVAAHGSADKARRGQASAQSFVRRLRASDGAPEPLCVDTIGFDASQRNATAATAGVEPSADARRIVAVPLQRDEATRCAGVAASVRYRYNFVTEAAASPSSVIGLVEFTAMQTRAGIAVAVPPEAVALRVSLESVATDTRVDEAAREWLVDLVSPADRLAGEIPGGDGGANGGGAADGRLWQQLTWIALVGAVVMTALVVAAGRLVCWRAPAWAWRRAKLFQYSTLRLRRNRAEKTPSGGQEENAARAEETDELRTHLEEIQQLNDSLDGLLLAAAHGASTSLASSPRSLATVEPSPSSPTSRPTMSGWRRSLRRVSISPSLPKTE